MKLSSTLTLNWLMTHNENFGSKIFTYLVNLVPKKLKSSTR